MPVVAHEEPGGGRGWRLVDDHGEPVTLVNEYLSYLSDVGRSPNTIRAYAYDMQYLLRFLEKEKLLFQDFRPKHSVTFLKYLREDASKAARASKREEKAPSGRQSPMRLSDATVARVLAAVASFYEFLIVSELYGDEHPMLTTEGGKPVRPRALGANSRQVPIRRRVRVKTPERLPRPMARSDVEAFLDSLTTLRDRAIFLLCVNGGLRPAEVLTLRLSNIHYGLRRVSITVQNQDPRGLRTKSREERIIDLHDADTLKALSDYVMHERPTGAPTDLVFLVGRQGSRRLEPVSYWAINRLFTRRLTALGLRTPWTTPHALRHTHATELYAHGMRDMTLQKRLGHKSPQSTKIYTRVADHTVKDDYVAALQHMSEQEKQA
ncbi:tyrosine-type recombinase/integrase [Cellulomonas marina]|uniref:Site-specific recombinase XerD n=1 Tax=Cellulomonas marina TaxID=988821 RepID=A0A1I1AX56_9CELL|nr:tyrosine-type recombinase/integrase [Cellulomonas marina]GIG30707.1 integrase [Cellulomonas marina]SFB42102.1 Site-specific recombinase XerD [Cellulomonas marina]